MEIIIMKVLIINDLYECGGAEIMARLQKKILENNGHKVLLLTLDTLNKEHNSKERGHISIGRKYNVIESVLYRYTCDKDIKHRIEAIIKQFEPDVTHLHNIYLSSKAIYLAVKGTHCVQTVHDYSITCVKSTSIYTNGELCYGYCSNNCVKKCLRGSLKEIAIFIGRYFAMHINNELRRRCVEKFISPSKFLKDICITNGFDTVEIANPMELNLQQVNPLEDRFCSDKKLFLYFGAINKVKGIRQLIEAFNEFSKTRNNVQLLIAGTVKRDFEKEFNGLIKNKINIKYLGKVPHDEINKLLNKVYVVIIPSLWIENFPGTLLEAVASGCLVIASDRGGMPEILENKEILFNVMDKRSIVKAMEYVLSIDLQCSLKIIQNNQRKVLKKCNVESYYNQLIDLYANVLKK